MGAFYRFMAQEHAEQSEFFPGDLITIVSRRGREFVFKGLRTGSLETDPETGLIHVVNKKGHTLLKFRDPSISVGPKDCPTLTENQAS